MGVLRHYFVASGEGFKPVACLPHSATDKQACAELKSETEKTKKKKKLG